MGKAPFDASVLYNLHKLKTYIVIYKQKSIILQTVCVLCVGLYCLSVFVLIMSGSVLIFMLCYVWKGVGIEAAVSTPTRFDC